MEILTEKEFRTKINIIYQQERIKILNEKWDRLSKDDKLIIIEMVHYSEESIKVNFSVFLSDKLNHNYTYLSNVFRSVNGMTIQQFIIVNKIEKIKELLLYGELNLSEISYKLNYSSIAHLSNQFKKVTGITPSYYKQNESKNRIPIDNLVQEISE
jgi:AraC-like DNA-binding protein